MKKILFIMSIVLSVLMITACDTAASTSGNTGDSFTESDFIGTWKSNTITNDEGSFSAIYSFYDNGTYILRYFNPTTKKEYLEEREVHNDWKLTDSIVMSDGENLFWDISYNKSEKKLSGSFYGFTGKNDTYSIALTKIENDEYESVISASDFIGTWKTNNITDGSQYYCTYSFEEENILTIKYFNASDNTEYLDEKKTHTWTFQNDEIALYDESNEMYSGIIFTKSKSQFSGKPNRDLDNLKKITIFKKQP